MNAQRRRPMRRIGDLIPDAARASAWRTNCASHGRCRRSRRSSRSGSRPRPERAGRARSRASRSIVEADAPIVAQELRLRSGSSGGLRGRARRYRDPGPSGPRSSRRSPRIIPGPACHLGATSPIRSGHGTVPSPDQTYREARMAARLQLKLGIVAEHDRLDDSPDTLVVVEPSVGSVARSKGNLYLLVTSRISSRHALEATRLAAETIRNEYYYDESAGIRVCLQKAIATANKRLLHQADRLGLRSPAEDGPIGVGVGGRTRQRDVRRRRSGRRRPTSSARRASRRCRIRTASAACPSDGLEPEVWRGGSDGRRLARPRSRRISWRASVPRSSRTPWSRSIRSRRWSISTSGSRRPTAPAATGRSPSRRPRSRRRAADASSSRSGRPSRWPVRPIARRSRSPTTSRPRARPSRRRRKRATVAGTAFDAPSPASTTCCPAAGPPTAG